MKVKMTDKTGAVREVNASYGMRLIEQGKAVICREGKKAAKPVKAEKSAVNDGAL